MIIEKHRYALNIPIPISTIVLFSVELERLIEASLLCFLNIEAIYLLTSFASLLSLRLSTLATPSAIIFRAISDLSSLLSRET